MILDILIIIGVVLYSMALEEFFFRNSSILKFIKAWLMGLVLSFSLWYRSLKKGVKHDR
jgi:hypothetical protein